MEGERKEIRVSRANFVDITGTQIGIYDDDSGWWQKLINGKNDSFEHVDGKVSPSNESTSSKSKLIAKNNQEKSGGKNQKKSEDPSSMKSTMIGETPLHIAIMYNDMNTIKYLIETKGYNINQRCVGSQFSAGFNYKEAAAFIKDSKYDELAYYGEYPLALAGCFSNKEIYDYLLEKGGDPNLQDSNGNTVLHTLVINNRIEMFLYAANHPKIKGSLAIKNNQELTPPNLAAMIGRKSLFEKILELKRMEIWSWSTTQCTVYPLEGIDTIHSDGTLLWNCALSFIINGETEDHLDMLEIGMIKTILQEKWTTYAKKNFNQKIIIACIHLLLLSIAVYSREADRLNVSVWPVTSATTWVRYISELLVVLMCIIYLLVQIKEIYGQGFKVYLRNLAAEPANVLYITFCVLVITAVPFRFVTFPDSETTGITPKNVEDCLIILAIPMGWCYLLFFARVFETTGPFVVMLYKMVVGDITTFTCIYGFLLFGYSLAFYTLYQNAGTNGKEYKVMNNYGEAIMLTFQMTLGNYFPRVPEFDHIYYSDFIKVVFVTNMLICHILLINMLIAMMGNTYKEVLKTSTKEYKKLWSNLVLLIEKSFSPPALMKAQDRYCIKLGDVIGLMVIKERTKTRAITRMLAIKNWKKFYKTVLDLLKESKPSDILKKWDEFSNKAVKPKKIKKPFDWSHYDPKSNSKSPKIDEQQKKKNNDGIAFSGPNDEPPKAYFKPEPKLMLKPVSLTEPLSVQKVNEKNNNFSVLEPRNMETKNTILK